MASIPQEIIEKHNQLLLKLCEQMNIDDDGYKQFILFMKNTDLPQGRLSRVQRDPTQLFDLMQQKGKLKVGDYSVLEKALQNGGVKDLLEIVKVQGKEITDLMKRQDHTKNVAKETAHESVELPNKENASEVKDAGDQPRKEYNREKKKGLLLILNFTKDREGTELDVSTLKKFFKDTLNFDVQDPREDRENDLSLSDLDEVFEQTKIVLNFQAKNYYCFFCAILSHGDEQGICFSDGQRKTVDEITKTFTNDKMKNFVGKPRVFLIQACRGSATQKDHDMADDWPADISDVTGKISVPTDADVLIAYATTPGNRAWRRENIGSWFIHVTISVFEERHMQEHVEEMFITVKDEIAHDEKWKPASGKRMMPCTWSTLTKRLKI